MKNNKVNLLDSDSLNHITAEGGQRSDESSASGHMPIPEIDVDIELNKTGLYQSNNKDPEQIKPVNLTKELLDAEEKRRTKLPNE